MLPGFELSHLLIFPVPYSLNKLLSSKVMPGQILFSLELFLHHNLCGDSCMVTPRVPQTCLTIHTMPERKQSNRINIFDHILKQNKHFWLNSEMAVKSPPPLYQCQNLCRELKFPTLRGMLLPFIASNRVGSL